MNKTTTFAAIALGFAAAFSAQAQNLSDPADQGAYGATAAVYATVKTAAAADAKATRSFAGLFTRSASSVDAVDQAAYGATPAGGPSLRTRAEVRAEAIAARDAGADADWREGGDPQYAVMNRAKKLDTAHIVAGSSAKAGE